MKLTLAILLTICFLSGCGKREDKSVEAPVEIEITASDLNYFNGLSEAEIALIDNTLYEHTTAQWQKIAMVVGMSLTLQEQFPELDDVKLLIRVHHLISANILESQGNIKTMRFSEVKRK